VHEPGRNVCLHAAYMQLSAARYLVRDVCTFREFNFVIVNNNDADANADCDAHTDCDTHADCDYCYITNRMLWGCIHLGNKLSI
jgi:hypothetical protein